MTPVAETPFLTFDGCVSVPTHAISGLQQFREWVHSTWESRLSGRVRLGESAPGSGRYVELVGSPDLIVEIVSTSSVRKDTVLLLRQYFEAGVSEYWLVDARGAEVDFQGNSSKILYQ